jgi:copper(I)-binding protein
MKRNALLRGGMGFVATFAMALCATDAAAVFVITEPWVRSAANPTTAEAYMELVSSDGSALVGVRSAGSARAELRAPGTKRDVVDRIDLPKGTKVVLAPGAYRIALSGLAKPLHLGDRIPLVLIVVQADGARQEYDVNAEVRHHSPTDDHKNGHRH